MPTVSGGGGTKLEPTSDFFENIEDLGLASAGTDQLQQRVRANEAQKQQASAIIAFHFGQRFPDEQYSVAIDPLAEKLMEAAGGDPNILASFANEPNSLWALTDDEIAEKVTRGEPLGELDSWVDAAAEVLWEVGAEAEAVQWVKDRQDNIKGTFEAITLEQAEEAFESGDPKRLGHPGKQGPHSFQGKFGEPGAWSYDSDANILAVTVGENTFGLKPRIGFAPKDFLDVLIEVVVAAKNPDENIIGTLDPAGRGVIGKVMEIANEMGQWVDAHPTAGETIDSLWRGLLDLTVAGSTLELSEVSTPGDRTTPGPIALGNEVIDAEKREVNTKAVAQLAAMTFPADMVIAQIAPHILTLAEEEGVDLTNQDALALAAEAVQDDRDNLESVWEQGTQDQLVSLLEAEIEGKTGLGVAVEQGLEQTLSVIEAYDSVVQFIGVNAIHRFGPGTIVQALTDDEDDNPWTLFKAAFESFTTSPEADNIAEYWGLEGGAADTALLAVGIAFDPVNLFIPGAKGQRALFRQAMTNPEKYGAAYLRSGSVRSVTKGIANDVGTPALSKVLYLELGPGSDDYYRRLFLLAVDPNATVKQVDDVLLDAIQNGFFLGAGPNRAVRQSTIHGFARMVDSLAAGKLTESQADMIFDMTGILGRTRTVSLGENHGLSEVFDLIQQFHPTNPDDMLDWSRRALDSTGPAMSKAEMGVMAAQKEKARRGIAAFEHFQTELGGKFDVAGAQVNRDALAGSLRHVDDLAGKVLSEGELRAVDENIQLIQDVVTGSVDISELRARRPDLADLMEALDPLARPSVDSKIAGDSFLDAVLQDAQEQIVRITGIDFGAPELNLLMP